MESTNNTPVDPIRPVAPYLGGKRNLAKRVCAIIDADDHTTYAEPFVGMGGIFLRRTRRPSAEFINDYGREVHNLFRILQEHYVAFLDIMRFQLTTQANFNRLLNTDPETLTDLQRAARFLYLQRTAFGGKPFRQNFGISCDRPSRFNISSLKDDLEALHDRLCGVTITCLNYDIFIQKIDHCDAFFYLDPPYWGCETDYGKLLFERDDFQRIADQLGKIKGRFLMSINDVGEIREMFARYFIVPMTTSYSVGTNNKNNINRAELLVSNFAWVK
ncbi:MAG: DNA adenine methylase [Pseudomonadota bacterium]